MRHVLKRPILTEKSTALSNKAQYVFEVDVNANKIEIRKAVESRYRVDVASVRTITVRPQARVQMTRKGWIQGKTKWRKKAIVSLKQGQTIDIVGDLPTEE